MPRQTTSTTKGINKGILRKTALAILKAMKNAKLTAGQKAAAIAKIKAAVHARHASAADIDAVVAQLQNR